MYSGIDTEDETEILNLFILTWIDLKDRTLDEQSQCHNNGHSIIQLSKSLAHCMLLWLAYKSLVICTQKIFFFWGRGRNNDIEEDGV